MPRSFALGQHFEQFIDAQVKSGRYNNASEVVRAGLRLLEDSQPSPAIGFDDLRELIRQGMDSGAPQDAESVLDGLAARYEDRSRGGSA